MRIKARLLAIVATLTMLWGAAAADWPLDLIAGWPHG